MGNCARPVILKLWTLHAVNECLWLHDTARPYVATPINQRVATRRALEPQCASVRDRSSLLIDMQAVKKFAVGRWSRASFSAHDRADPPPRERLELPQMQHAAEVLRDEFGVPHIYAETEHDLFLLHGFCQAEDRLWQMEGLRRVAAGRVSELMGPGALTVDKFARTLGWSRRAAEEWRLLCQSEDPNATRAVAMLTAYCDGVNAFIDQAAAEGGRGNMLNAGRLPFFFMLLKVDPEPWRPEDTLGILRVLCYQMNHGGQHPAIRQLLANIVGEDDALRWSRTDRDPTTGKEWPPTRPSPLESRATPKSQRKQSNAEDVPTVKPAATTSARFATAVPDDVLLRTLAGQPSEREIPSQGQGSNWWALGTERTSTGGPLLANDPHLSVRVPSIWYESHLHAKETGLHTAGVQMPGFPITIIGHNDHVCIGVTLGYTDTEDLFMERFVGPKDPRLGHSTSYMHEGLVKEVATYEERIVVKGEAETVMTVAETVHGPVVSQCAGDHVAAYDVARAEAVAADDRHFATHDADGVTIEIAFCAKGLAERTGAMEALYALAHATDVNSARAAFEHVAAPSLNIGLADDTGNIGYALVGRVPLRGCMPGAEMMPLVGWTGDNDWSGDIPWELMPHSINPEGGKLVSANHRIVPTTDDTSYLGNIWVAGWRAQAIHDALDEWEAKGVRVGLHENQALQMDFRCIPGEHFRDLFALNQTKIKTTQQLSEIELAAMGALVAWDGRMEAASIGATVYELTADAVADLVFECLLARTATDSRDNARGKSLQAERLLQMATGQGIDASLRGRSELKNGVVSTVLEALAQPSSWYLPNDDAVPVMAKALRIACTYLEAKLGRDVSEWRWGELHVCHFTHQGAGQLGDFLNAPPFEFGGNADTIAQVSIANIGGEQVSC